jgi:hypothetical protein
LNNDEIHHQQIYIDITDNAHQNSNSQEQNNQDNQENQDDLDLKLKNRKTSFYQAMRRKNKTKTRGIILEILTE